MWPFRKKNILEKVYGKSRVSVLLRGKKDGFVE